MIMDTTTYLFEDFAQDLLNNVCFKNWVDMVVDELNYKSDHSENDLNEWLVDYDYGDEYTDFLASDEAFALACSTDKRTFLTYLNHYYDAAWEYYKYWEYECSGFNGRIFWPYNTYILSLCVKYFESVKEQEKRNISCLLIMCYLSVEEDPTEYDESFAIYETFEYIFNSIKQLIEPDWQVVHPSITWHIGRYYLAKENYRKAREFFSLGASLDYYGRQSNAPFIAVGKNQYEMGMTYYKGLGVKVNPKKALTWFNMAAYNADEPTIPIIQDMQNEGLLPMKYEPTIAVLNGYGRCNIHNVPLHIYYTELNDEQIEKLKNAADLLLQQESMHNFETLVLLYNVYRYRLFDNEKTGEVAEKLYECVAPIPVNKRDQEMNEYYISGWKRKWVQSVEKPHDNSGDLPKNLKPGDIFFYGTFNGEPIEWKVLEPNEDGSLFVITRKILFKMGYKGTIEWLNKKFVENVFSEDELKHIKVYRDNGRLYDYVDPVYLYIADYSQIENLEDLDQEIEETELAKSMSKDKGFFGLCGHVIIPGQESFSYSLGQALGIRPAMDIYPELPLETD